MTLAQVDEVAAAKIAGLHYSLPGDRGITRHKAGSGFSYRSALGKVLRDPDVLRRIRSLVIPPAWTSVSISADPNSHVQAVGRDAKGRKQYCYHPKYREVRDLVKFDRMKEFGQVLPKIRKKLAADLAQHDLNKTKVLAAVVKLLETTYIRVGNEEYAQENDSFGLTTLRNQHVKILGDLLKFKFRGKSGQNHEIAIKDRRLASIVRKTKCLPGSQLFQYLDEEGNRAAVDSGNVNEYLRAISGGDFTAKDFRTWAGTTLAASSLILQATPPGEKELKSALVEVVKEVASKLGNRPATCRKYYIHPALFDTFATGRLHELAQQCSVKGGEICDELVLAVLDAVPDLPKVRKKIQKAA